MDHAEPAEAAPEEMVVERVVRDDGRQLLLFSWRPSGPDDAATGDVPA